MRQRTVLFVSLVAGTVLFNACSDTTRPTPASDDKVGFDPLQQPDDPVALVRNIPGFGGFFFDREGVPTVYLRDVSARAQVERALGALAPGRDPGRRASGAPGGFDWARSNAGRLRLPRRLAYRGAVSSTPTKRNRLGLGWSAGYRRPNPRGTPRGSVGRRIVEETGR